MRSPSILSVLALFFFSFSSFLLPTSSLRLYPRDEPASSPSSSFNPEAYFKTCKKGIKEEGLDGVTKKPVEITWRYDSCIKYAFHPPGLEAAAGEYNGTPEGKERVAVVDGSCVKLVEYM